MENTNWKSSNIIMVFLMFGLISACNNGQEQTTAEVGEAPEMSEMEGMEIMEEGAAEAVNPVALEGEPAFLANYVAVKNALFQDDYKEVKKVTLELASSLGRSEELNKGQIRDLQTATIKIAEAENIEVQRRFFAELSQELYQVVQNSEVTEQKLYWQHCPMALESKGANWLSYEEKIQNPFMGQRMPYCGSVAETLN